MTKEHSHLQQIEWKFARSEIVMVSLSAGLLQHIARQASISPEAAAESLCLDTRATRKFFIALERLGVLTRKNGGYSLSDQGSTFVDWLSDRKQLETFQELLTEFTTWRDAHVKWMDANYSAHARTEETDEALMSMLGVSSTSRI